MSTSCCHRAALDLEAGYCDDCGAPLLRCPAHEECGGLLDADGRCPVCIAPELLLDAGGLREARVGGALSLPLVLRNGARTGRPLFVHGVWTREAGGDWRSIELAWDRVDAGAAAPFTVRAEELGRAGVHALEIMLAVSNRWRWREEVLAFAAGLSVTVEQEEALTVQQNITYAADAPQTGATIYAPFRYQAEGGAAVKGAPTAAQPLLLTRAGKLERSFGLRGYDGGPVVSRAARIAWRGFGAGEAPADGPIVSADGLVTLGRSRAKPRGGSNDVRLLAHDGTGDLDEESSRGISRQHFHLCIENDRLLLRVESDRGAWINGEAVPRGTSVFLRDGDRFSPLPRGRGWLVVNVGFEEHHGRVETVTLTRA